ncbi:hypothetical protein [Rhabdothermincola salaria]|uniref:hypothetical protein n=1 Tax=Rhabdothermincola salaria TaxID=2903142 RepID=UPI001E51BF71|nr:hypothetical protein [Rhabdothermincola salaria]MCD9625252.1 hypothetical protein [Rhabdothermincola salaria]
MSGGGIETSQMHPRARTRWAVGVALGVAVVAAGVVAVVALAGDAGHDDSAAGQPSAAPSDIDPAVARATLEYLEEPGRTVLVFDEVAAEGIVEMGPTAEPDVCDRIAGELSAQVGSSAQLRDLTLAVPDVELTNIALGTQAAALDALLFCDDAAAFTSEHAAVTSGREAMDARLADLEVAAR